MAQTYTPIATTTLGSAASSITFSSIPSTYTDLRVVCTYLSTGSDTWIGLQFNGVTTALYSDTYIRGIGTAAQSSYQTNVTRAEPQAYSNANTTIPALAEMDIMSYASNNHKTTLWKTSIDKNGTGEVNSAVVLFRSTSAITSITLRAENWNFAAGTTATLYGIKSA